MEFAIGLVLSLAVTGSATAIGLDRDRAFYPTILIVIASYFDFVHHLFIENPGAPHWWPGFCLGFDATAGGFLAVLLVKRSSLSPNPG